MRASIHYVVNQAEQFIEKMLHDVGIIIPIALTVTDEQFDELYDVEVFQRLHPNYHMVSNRRPYAYTKSFTIRKGHITIMRESAVIA